MDASANRYSDKTG